MMEAHTVVTTIPIKTRVQLILPSSILLTSTRYAHMVFSLPDLYRQLQTPGPRTQSLLPKPRLQVWYGLHRQMRRTSKEGFPAALLICTMKRTKTEEEAQMQKHVSFGESILCSTPFPRSNICYCGCYSGYSSVKEEARIKIQQQQQRLLGRRGRQQQQRFLGRRGQQQQQQKGQQRKKGPAKKSTVTKEDKRQPS